MRRDVSIAIAICVLTFVIACEPETPPPPTQPTQPELRPKIVEEARLPGDAVSRVPLKQGECIETRVIEMIPRLYNICSLGPKGQPTETSNGGIVRGDCGLRIVYGFGDQQALWTTNIEVKDTWRLGDPIKICRLDKPTQRCEPGEYQIYAKYLATNLRTNTSVKEINRFTASDCEELPKPP